MGLFLRCKEIRERAQGTLIRQGIASKAGIGMAG
jgi:hypothetical protein